MTIDKSQYPANLFESILRFKRELGEHEAEGLIFRTDKLDEVLARLKDRDQKIIDARFKRKLSGNETAREFGITRERIRQLENHALRILGKPENLACLTCVPYAEYAALEQKYKRAVSALKTVKALSTLSDEAIHTLDQAITDAKGEATVPPAQADAKTRQMPISQLNLSIRAYHALTKNEIYTVAGLCSLTQCSLWDLPHVGPKLYEEILSVLRTMGIELPPGKAKPHKGKLPTT